MNLLEEVIADDKFERNARFFKKTLYVSVIAAILLIGVSLFRSYQTQQNESHDRHISVQILEGKVKVDDLENLTGKSKLEDLAKFAYVTNYLEKNLLQHISENKNEAVPPKNIEDFQANVLGTLESLRQSQDPATSLWADTYIWMLILDHPEYFNADNVEKYSKILDIRVEQNLSEIAQQMYIEAAVMKVNNMIWIKGMWLKLHKPNEFEEFYHRVISTINTSGHPPGTLKPQTKPEVSFIEQNDKASESLAPSFSTNNAGEVYNPALMTLHLLHKMHSL